MLDPEFSDYFRKMNAKRKKKVGGFKSLETQHKIQESKKRNAKSKDRQSRQAIQPVDKDEGQVDVPKMSKKV